MKKLKYLLNALRAGVITAIMPGALQDETTKAQNYVPHDTLHREKLQGPFPEDNPYLNKPNEAMRRMRWDEEHGWADYS